MSGKQCRSYQTPFSTATDTELILFVVVCLPEYLGYVSRTVLTPFQIIGYHFLTNNLINETSALS